MRENWQKQNMTNQSYAKNCDIIEQNFVSKNKESFQRTFENVI